MRISHRYKFVFLSHARTGSQTVRRLLDPFSDVTSVHYSQTDETNPFYNHISALELKNEFDRRCWDWSAYRKFCFTRNPWERVVSLYHHFVRGWKSKRDITTAMDDGADHGVTRVTTLSGKASRVLKRLVPAFHEHCVSMTANEIAPSFKEYVSWLPEAEKKEWSHPSDIRTSLKYFACDTEGNLLLDDVIPLVSAGRALTHLAVKIDPPAAGVGGGGS